MNYSKLFLWSLATTGLGLFLYDQANRIIWDGGFEVPITLQGVNVDQIQSISAGATFQRNYNELDPGFPYILNELVKPIPLEHLPNIQVHVLCSGHESGLGREIRYVQQDRIVIKITYLDGQTIYKVLETPPRGRPRQLTLFVA